MLNLRALGPAAAVMALLQPVATTPADAHGHVRVGVSVGYGYPYHHAPGWYGPGWYGPGWYGPPYYGPVYLSDWAVIDTDVSPEKAEVWLDGEYAGLADRFDGFPGYLEVEPGRHRLEFRYEGYRTLRIDLRARPGGLYRIDRQLREGPAEPVEVAGGPTVPVPDHGTEIPARETMIGLRILPGDAAVYLDDRLLGTADDVARVGLREIEEGDHTVEVVRPGYRSWKETIHFERGETRMVRVELQPEE